MVLARVFYIKRPTNEDILTLKLSSLRNFFCEILVDYGVIHVGFVLHVVWVAYMLDEHPHNSNEKSDPSERYILKFVRLLIRLAILRSIADLLFSLKVGLFIFRGVWRFFLIFYRLNRIFIFWRKSVVFVVRWSIHIFLLLLHLMRWIFAKFR